MTKITQGDKILLHSTVSSPLQQLSDPLFDEHRIKVYIKRDDLIHPQISGNKWRKLKYNLLYAKQQGYNEVLSFGGAYSNHIHSLAFAGQANGLKTIGIIRGEYDPNNPTIRDAKEAGMHIEFVNRSDYRRRFDQDYLSEIQDKYPNALIVPEGGTNDLALLGLAEMVEEIPKEKAQFIITACGSGGTSAGILKAMQPEQTLISIPVLKKADYLKQEIIDLAKCNVHQLQFLTEFHQGGYGKVTPELVTFIEQFETTHAIQLEPIYNGKMMIAFYQLVRENYFKPHSSVTLIHTGGLQGLNGLKQRGIIN
ncbi:pyridoxal-phosphate dependent enzyme [Psychrobium sp. MM17-31]|uniref:1-aminocyclopropane-1-carboxylate deaminase/D-cysteine desulfhydrase n=1 Tax=Psychrobium sp. MM17-31 TaxID=2917758 RepID=UPI001EF5FAFE|nr:pyridoxal-phosphate dependent enzyme [Psychrobium sp. MM17-31]